MQIEQSTLKTTMSGICTVEDGVIYEVNNLYGQKNRIGVTDSTYKELKNVADEYYKKLVELGAIVPPKTPEEVQAETMQVMSGLLEQMKAMKLELEGLKNERKSIGPYAGHESREQSKATECMERGPKVVRKCK